MYPEGLLLTHATPDLDYQIHMFYFKFSVVRLGNVMFTNILHAYSSFKVFSSSSHTRFRIKTHRQKIAAKGVF